MATFVLEDLGGRGRGDGVPEDDDRSTATCSTTTPSSCVKGRLDLRDDTPKIIAMEVTRPELVARQRAAGAHPGRSSTRSPTPRSARLKDILAEHPGDSPVFVHLESPEKTTVLRLGDEHLVDAGNGLFAELRVLLGADCIT